MRISQPSLKKTYSQKDFEHKCQLPPIDNLLIRYICNGYFVDLRRKFKSILVVSDTNPKAQWHLRSTTAIYFEKYKHLQYHYYMIHPFSIGRFYWEIFMMVVYYIILLYIPMDVCLTANSNYEQIPRILQDCICWIDIVLTFHTGYQDPRTNKVVMSRKDIQRHYLLSWFFVDVLSSVNFGAIRFILGFEPSAHYWLLRIPSYLKIFRLATLLLYLERLREWHPFNYLLYQIIKTATTAVIIIFWCSSTLFIVANLTHEEWMPRLPEQKFQAFSLCIAKIVYCFLGVKPGHSNHWILRIFEFIWLSSGWLLRLLIMAQVVKLVMKYSSIFDNFNYLVQEFEEYMKTKKLPNSVKRKVVAYLKLRYRNKYFKEANIFNTLSIKLKQEVTSYISRNVLANVSMFKSLPDHLLELIGASMKLEIFLPNDVVFSAGSPGDFMVFIHHGMISFYDDKGDEMCHMAEDDFFGEMCLFEENYKRQTTAIAVDFCETYTLKRSDFKSIMSPYPDILYGVERETYAQYSHLTISKSHVIPDSDIGGLFDPSIFSSYRR